MKFNNQGFESRFEHTSGPQRWASSDNNDDDDDEDDDDDDDSSRWRR